MPTFRYQAVQSNGVLVFGTQDATSDSQLADDLSAKRLTLIQATELNIDAAIGTRTAPVPRLYQLRIGERLREAWLTRLPAHEAVRAMAAEPFEHPILNLMPWLFSVSVIMLLPAIGWSCLVPGNLLPFAVGLLIAFVVLPVAWLLSFVLLDRWPRQTLHRLADRLESGMSDISGIAEGMNSEVRAVLRADINDRQKALAVSDLVPTQSGSRFFEYRFLIGVTGAVALLSLFLTAMYWVLWQVVLPFAKIFEDFDTELPLMTKMMVSIAGLFEPAGGTGFVACVLGSVALCVAVWICLTNGVTAELISHTPVLGVPLRWLRQARVAKILSSLLRADCDRAEALRAATAASSFPSIRADGEAMANALKTGFSTTGYSKMLSGLPLSLLSAGNQSGGEHSPKGNRADQSAMLSQNFAAIARMLEQASQGHGMFVAFVIQLAVGMFALMVVGFVVVSLFLPLIKLLNDLA